MIIKIKYINSVVNTIMKVIDDSVENLSSDSYVYFNISAIYKENSIYDTGSLPRDMIKRIVLMVTHRIRLGNKDYGDSVIINPSTHFLTVATPHIINVGLGVKSYSVRDFYHLNIFIREKSNCGGKAKINWDEDDN